MNNLSQHSAFRILISRVPITLHALQQFGQVLTKTLGLALFFFALSFVMLCYQKLSAIGWYTLVQSAELRFKIHAMGSNMIQVIRESHYHPWSLKAWGVCTSPAYQVYKQRLMDDLFEAGWQSLLLSGLCLGALGYLRRKGKQKVQHAHPRLGEDEDPYRDHPLSPKDGSDGLCFERQEVASKRISDLESPFEALQNFKQSKEENL
jgi:hypothetical protein